MSGSGYFDVEKATTSNPEFDLMEDSGVVFEDEDKFPDETPGERLGAIFEDEENSQEGPGAISEDEDEILEEPGAISEDENEVLEEPRAISEDEDEIQEKLGATSQDEEEVQDESDIVFEEEAHPREETLEERLAVKKLSLKKCAEDMVSEHSEAVALSALAKKIESGLKEINHKLLQKNEIVQYFIKRNGELSTEIREDETNIKFFHLESSLSMKTLECEQLFEENQKLLEKVRLYEEAVNGKGKIDVGALLVENCELKRKLESSSTHPELDHGAPPHEELQSEATFVNPDQVSTDWKETPKVQEFIAETVRSALSQQRKSMKHLFFVGQRVRNRFLERNSAYDPKAKERNSIHELGNSSVYNGRPITDATLFSHVPDITFEKRTDEATFKELYWASWQTVLKLQDCAEFIEMLRWHSSVKAWRKADYMNTEFFKVWTKNIDTTFEDMDLPTVREYCTNITRKTLKACYLDEKRRNMRVRRIVDLKEGNERSVFTGVDMGWWKDGVLAGVLRCGVLGLIVVCQFVLWMLWWLQQYDVLRLEGWLDTDMEIDLE